MNAAAAEAGQSTQTDSEGEEPFASNASSPPPAPAPSSSSYRLSLNQFADMSSEEWDALFAGNGGIALREVDELSSRSGSGEGQGAGGSEPGHRNRAPLSGMAKRHQASTGVRNARNLQYGAISAADIDGHAGTEVPPGWRGVVKEPANQKPAAAKSIPEAVTVSAQSTATSSTSDDAPVRALDASFPSLDWRSDGSVSPIKAQGECNACYAFATVAAVESQVFRSTGTTPNLSEQQIVDCSENDVYSNEGCKWGYIASTLQYTVDNGLCSEDAYPYGISLGPNGAGACRSSQCDTSAFVSDWVAVQPRSEGALMDALQHSPVVVSVQASGVESFRFYKGGVMDSGDCPGWCTGAPSRSRASIQPHAAARYPTSLDHKRRR